MLAILGALDREIAGVRKGMTVEKTISENGFRLYLGKYAEKPLLLVKTGMGKQRAESAARLALEQYPVSALVSMGFAGGLTGESKVGDIVLCSTLYCNDRHGNTDNALQSDAKLLALCSQALTGKVTRLRQGKTLTVERPICTPDEKLAAGQSYRADVVEMESYWIASVACEKHIPFIAVRVISDDSKDLLPPFEIFKTGGGLKWHRALPYFLLHPRRAAGLIVLRRRAREAQNNLTAFLDYLIAKV
ncbi:MAG: hypothetical protein HYX79_03790 [Chloroflexi bacterium]|nr:hypothetical protein [Chloroflexota bacterium]